MDQAVIVTCNNKVLTNDTIFDSKKLEQGLLFSCSLSLKFGKGLSTKKTNACTNGVLTIETISIPR